MKRLALFLLVLAPTAASAQRFNAAGEQIIDLGANNDVTQSAAGNLQAQVTSTNATQADVFNGAGDSVGGAMNGAIGSLALFSLDVGTLDATIVPQCDLAGDATWQTGFFYNPTTLATTTSLVVTNPNPNVELQIVCPGAWQSRAYVSAFTSGTANADFLAVTGTSPLAFAQLRNSSGAESATASAPLRVDPTGSTTQPISAASLPLPTGASTLAEQQSQTSALEIMDDWDETNRAAVNTIAGQVGVQGGAGASTALTQRVALATDANTIQGTVTANAGTGSFTVVGNKSSNGGVPGATNLGTLPAVANAAAPTHTETNQVALRTQLDGDLVVEMEDALPAGDNNVGNVDVASMPSNTTATGTLTAPAQVVTITVPQGGSSIGLQVTGTWTGQIEFEATVDGTNYISVYASNNSGTSTNATTVNGGFILPGAGFLTVRVRASALSSGTANISFNASVGTSGATLTGPLPAGTNNVGDVDVATIAGGDNNIGNVDIVTFPDNEPVDVALMNGVAVTMGNGASGTGVQRVTIASDSTGQVAVASLPNEGQQTAANSISVTPDTDNDSIGATGAAPPGEATYVGGLSSGATGGFLTSMPVCLTSEPIDITTATTTLEITGVSGRHVYICAINLVTAAANNVTIIAGTGATCGTSTAALVGGTTAAEGWNFAANGGLAMGSGLGSVLSTNGAGATGDSVCIVTSAATQLAGTISYTIY
jgi:hypothetical protein